MRSTALCSTQCILCSTGPEQTGPDRTGPTTASVRACQRVCVCVCVSAAVWRKSRPTVMHVIISDYFGLRNDEWAYLISTCNSTPGNVTVANACACVQKPRNRMCWAMQIRHFKMCRCTLVHHNFVQQHTHTPEVCVIASQRVRESCVTKHFP